MTLTKACDSRASAALGHKERLEAHKDGQMLAQQVFKQGSSSCGGRDGSLSAEEDVRADAGAHLKIFGGGCEERRGCWSWK